MLVVVVDPVVVDPVVVVAVVAVVVVAGGGVVVVPVVVSGGLGPTTNAERAVTDEPLTQPSAVMRTGWPLWPTVTVTTWPGVSELCQPTCPTVTV